jgi:hypothetical protein
MQLLAVQQPAPRQSAKMLLRLVRQVSSWQLQQQLQKQARVRQTAVAKQMLQKRKLAVQQLTNQQQQQHPAR